ncbi:hypothetical protein [Pseudomonas fragi]|uniref:hypothetical protein n=1 Tax=Pseudomonas fragi TaxID=296 RepID=UPI001E45332A|nr:hypothetical protein [Pseudomonas fragi]
MDDLEHGAETETYKLLMQRKQGLARGDIAFIFQVFKRLIAHGRLVVDRWFTADHDDLWRQFPLGWWAISCIGRFIDCHDHNLKLIADSL